MICFVIYGVNIYVSKHSLIVLKKIYDILMINLLQAKMLDFKSCVKNLTHKYLVTERHMLKLQGILLQYLKFN